MRQTVFLISLAFLFTPYSRGQISPNFRIEADFFDSGGLGASSPSSANFRNTASTGQPVGGRSSQSQNFQTSSGAAGTFYTPTTPTGVSDNSDLPTDYALSQNYPNPFNPTTVISYELPKESHVSLKLYDVLGRDLHTIVNEKQPAGRYTVAFDASRFSSGVYLYRLTAESFVSTRKMILLR